MKLRIKNEKLRIGKSTAIFHYLCFSFFIFNSSFLISAQPVAVAKLDTAKIRLGDRAHLTLSMAVEKEVKVFPVAVPDSFQKLEVLSRTQFDTTRLADGKINYRQTVTITGFDSGYYVIHPLYFYYQQPGKETKDSVGTEAMLVQVETVPVDTTKSIRDIKPPIEVPYDWREAWPYALGGLALIAAIVAFIILAKRRKARPVEVKTRVLKRPAHEIALLALKKIREEKIWQQGHYKQYHSAVSDTIRQYIEDRYAIPALEMPSDDTLSHIRSQHLPADALDKLSYILHLADTVKFAKAIPIGTENELSLQQAIDFVMLTKPVTPGDFNQEKKEGQQQ